MAKNTFQAVGKKKKRKSFIGLSSSQEEKEKNTFFQFKYK